MHGFAASKIRKRHRSCLCLVVQIEFMKRQTENIDATRESDLQNKLFQTMPPLQEGSYVRDVLSDMLWL